MFFAKNESNIYINKDWKQSSIGLENTVIDVLIDNTFSDD